jgi:hypothetical protein
MARLAVFNSADPRNPFHMRSSTIAPRSGSVCPKVCVAGPKTVGIAFAPGLDHGEFLFDIFRLCEGILRHEFAVSIDKPTSPQRVDQRLSQRFPFQFALRDPHK